VNCKGREAKPLATVCFQPQPVSESKVTSSHAGDGPVLNPVLAAWLPATPSSHGWWKPHLSSAQGTAPNASPDLPPCHTHPRRHFPGWGTPCPQRHHKSSNATGLMPSPQGLRCPCGSPNMVPTLNLKLTGAEGGLRHREGLRPTGWCGEGRLGPTLWLSSGEG